MSLSAKLSDAIKNIATKHKEKMDKKVKPKKEVVKKPAEDDSDDSY